MVTKIGLDLGYANITISDTTAGVYREQSIALIDKDSRRIISVGDSSLQKAEELGEAAIMVRPFKNGILFDRQITESVVSHVTASLPEGNKIRCAIGVPSDLMQKQEKEIFDILTGAGIDDCFAVNRSVAALIGAGESPLQTVISANIGAAATEIAVFNEGELIYTHKENVGGEDFDKAIRQYISEQGGVNVSLAVARDIKERLGSVWQGKEEQTVEVEGILALTGNSVKMTISSEDIVGVFERTLHRLLMSIAVAIKEIPIENVDKALKNGIVLTGGGAMIHGLNLMIEKVLGVPVKMPEDPIDSVAKGLSIINTKLSARGRGMRKNVSETVASLYKDKK